MGGRPSFWRNALKAALHHPRLSHSPFSVVHTRSVSPQSAPIRADLSGTVGELFSGLENEETADDLDEHDKTRLAGLARLVAKALSHAQRDPRGRTKVYIPEPEAPLRLILVLAQLLRGMRTLSIPPWTGGQSLST
jgi:hypothetical protein